MRLGGLAGSETDVRGVVLDPASGNRLYGLRSDGIVRSVDFGDNFTSFATNLTSFSVREVQVDPFDGNHLIVEGNPVRQNGQGSVFLGTTLVETRDGGATWHSATAGLPRANDYTLKFSPSTPGMLLVAADILMGPFVSTALNQVDFHDVSTGLSTDVTNLFVKALTIRPRKAGEAAGSDRFLVGTEVGVFGSTTTFLSVPQLSVTPSNPTVAAGGGVTFSAGEPALWRVLAAPGENAGAINSAGVYTAPTRVPPSGLVTILGESIATGARGTATIAIAGATADGTFAPVTVLPIGGRNPVIDVDGDGIVDLVDVPRDSLGVEVRRGLGDGTFVAPIRSFFVRGPRLFEVGDINADGLPDLIGVDTFPVITTTRQPNIHIALGIGGGKFSPFSDRFVGLAPRDVALVDINGDTVNDLLVLDEGKVGGTTGSLIALLNDGVGNFGSPITYRTGGPQSTVMTTRDVNNDGQIDVVVGNQDGGIATFLNRGGTFAPAIVNQLGLGLPNFPRFNTGHGRPGRGRQARPDRESQYVAARDAEGRRAGHFTPLATIGGTFQTSFVVGHFNGDAHRRPDRTQQGVELGRAMAPGVSFVRRVVDGPAARSCRPPS